MKFISSFKVSLAVKHPKWDCFCVTFDGHTKGLLFFRREVSGE
jgi:hypothetical protein